MTDTIPPPDWDIELRALRAAATSAGIRGAVDPSETVRLDTADEMLARLLAADPVDELAARRRRTRRRILLASGIAAAGLVVTSVLQPWGGSPVQAATPAILDYEFATPDTVSVAPGKDPSATFASLAAAASAQPAPTSTSGVQHVVTDSWFAEVESTEDEQGASALIPQINETYLAADGSLRLVTRRDAPLRQDGRGLPQDGAWNDQPSTADETQPPGSVDADLAAGLPTDPKALRAELLDLSGCPRTGRSTTASKCLFDQVLLLNQSYVLTPRLDAAIWKVLDGEKGFRSLGGLEDRAGRDGVGLSLITAEQPEYRFVLIADPDTGEVLGNEEILIRSVDGLTIDAPAITAFSAILESEFVE